MCQLPDCGQCSHCRDMRKFGGSGKSKQACINRRCPNMAVQVAEDDENELAEPEVSKKSERKARSEKKAKTKLEWIGEPEKRGKKRSYTSVRINALEVHLFIVCVCVPAVIITCRLLWEIVCQ